VTPPPPVEQATTELTTSNGETTAVHPSLIAAVGDECVNCGARLAPEQRYCVECGERRGQSRLPFAGALEQRAQAPPPPPRRGPRLTANGALIAGIGTLILALGVGVLIGRSGNNSGSKNAAAPQIIRVPAGSATGTGTTTASAAGSGAKSTKSGAGKAASSKSKKPIIQQTVQKKGSNVPPPAVKVGSPGHGKGYKNGKFTGDFFGQ
jgi:hypothetical protein